jgi:hypothetical protein
MSFKFEVSGFWLGKVESARLTTAFALAAFAEQSPLVFPTGEKECLGRQHAVLPYLI